MSRPVGSDISILLTTEKKKPIHTIQGNDASGIILHAVILSFLMDTGSKGLSLLLCISKPTEVL